MDGDEEDLVLFKELPEDEHISRKRSVSTEDSDDRPLRRRRRRGSETAPEGTVEDAPKESPWTITQGYTLSDILISRRFPFKRTSRYNWNLNVLWTGERSLKQISNGNLMCKLSLLL